MEDIHDIKGQVPIPYPWWVWALAALALLGIACWIWKRRQAAVLNRPAVPPLTPFEAALAALQRLREENPPVEEEFYTRLSDIVRVYLERQFHIHAPERTTEEFLYEVSQGSRLTPEQKDLLVGFLQESDLVKFAKLRPGPADQQRVYAAAEKFVRDSVLTTAGVS